MVRYKVSSYIDQWKLIGILIVAIENFEDDVWINSFEKINLYPKHRVDYTVWVERISSHIITGEAACKRTNTPSMYDVMLTLWKSLTVENRHNILSIINNSTSNNSDPWINKSFLLKLAKYIHLDDVPKLRVSHQVAKYDLSIIVGTNLAAEDRDGAYSSSKYRFYCRYHGPSQSEYNCHCALSFKYNRQSA